MKLSLAIERWLLARSGDDGSRSTIAEVCLRTGRLVGGKPAGLLAKASTLAITAAVTALSAVGL